MEAVVAVVAVTAAAVPLPLPAPAACPAGFLATSPPTGVTGATGATGAAGGGAVVVGFTVLLQSHTTFATSRSWWCGPYVAAHLPPLVIARLILSTAWSTGSGSADPAFFLAKVAIMLSTMATPVFFIFGPMSCTSDATAFCTWSDPMISIIDPAPNMLPELRLRSLHLP